MTLLDPVVAGSEIVNTPVEPEPAVRTREIHVELIGARLRADGDLDIGAYARLSDYLERVEGFCTLRHARAKGLAVSGGNGKHELHVKLDQIAVIAQSQLESRPTGAGQVVKKLSHPLVIVTSAHVVSGTAHVHVEASLDAFLEAAYSAFIPLTDVQVRSLSGQPVGRYPFALVQRRHIVAVTEQPDDAEGSALERDVEP